MMPETSSSLSALPIGALFDQASSVAPVPGGGCVSAVCGYLAVSLLLKSIRISARAHPDDISYADVSTQLLTLAGRLLPCAQADSDSFNAYIGAIRLPKTTPEEIAHRQKAIHEAAVGATNSALDILDVGNQVLGLAHHVQGRISMSILADERSAVELTSAMNSTAEWNAAANIASLTGDTALATRLENAKAKHATLLAACHSI